MKDKKVLGGGAVLVVALFWFYIKPSYLDAKPAPVFTEAEIAASPRPTLVIAKGGGGGGHGAGSEYEGLVFNLKSPATAPAYVKVVIHLEFADPDRKYVGLTHAQAAAKDVKFAEEMAGEKAKILDTITLLFASKTVEEVSTAEGKIKLKEEMIEHLNEVLHGEKVEAVYFETFITQ